MNTQEYVKIGSRVGYLRHDTDLVVYEEFGTVRAIFLDPESRLMVQVKNGENAYNVHYTTLCVDHRPNALNKYKELIKDIRATSKEGDEVVQEIVEKYNKIVQEMTTLALGCPVLLDLMEEGE